VAVLTVPWVGLLAKMKTGASAPAVAPATKATAPKAEEKK
jgi:hypothetical protein